MGGLLVLKHVSFPDNIHYEFAMQFLEKTNAAQLGVIPQASVLEIEVRNPTVGRLLQRIGTRRTVIFPYIGAKNHSWIITGETRHQLDHTLTQVNRFIVPAYAEYATSTHMPQLQPFKGDGNRLQQLGADLYPVGYYSWRSPVKHFDTILRHLDIWMKLEEECPSFPIELHPTYRSLRDIFDASFAAANWQEAEKSLQEMRRLHLITAENVAFLQVQLLAQQQRWDDIWKRSDIRYLTRMRTPRNIRSALLTAFHHSVLLPLEQQGQWEKAFQTFSHMRPTLGLLLTGRFGLAQSPVLQVYAYQAALERDTNTFTELSSSNTTKEVQECISQLAQLVDMGTIAENNSSSATCEANDSSPIDNARLALVNLDYDAAIHFTREIPQPTERALLFIQIAFQNGDIPLAEEALLSYWDLSLDKQVQLEAQYPFLQRWLKYLEEVTHNSQASILLSNTSAPPIIQDWLKWFDVAKEEPDNPELTTSLERLAVSIDERFWNLDKVQLLNDRLLSFIIEPQQTYRPYMKVVLQKLVDLFLSNEAFPRHEEVYQELYETLYTGFLEQETVNITVGYTLLRLAEALLGCRPKNRDHICNHFINWCKTPIPALEHWALEVCDLLAEYGLLPGLLTTWYREWITCLLDLPGSRERVTLETWLIFGRWIQPGNDLLNRLEQALAIAASNDNENPIANLPDGYRIGIFSLRQSSTERAKQMLLARNKGLDIRICLEKDLNAQAKAIAQNSDLVVIVTTCMSHALTYGIGPYLKKEPVYPPSSGSTSLVRTIEGYVQQYRRA